MSGVTMNSNPVQIRDALGTDAWQVAKTHISSWQEAYAGQVSPDFLNRLPESFQRREEFWRRIADEPGEAEALLVAVTKSGVVGFVHSCRSRDEDSDLTVGEVTAIYVRRAWWSQGVGRRLMSEAMDRMRILGFTSAILWVLATNERARSFYESTGWRLNGRIGVETLGNQRFKKVRYGIDLRSVEYRYSKDSWTEV